MSEISPKDIVSLYRIMLGYDIHEANALVSIKLKKKDDTDACPNTIRMEVNVSYAGNQNF